MNPQEQRQALDRAARARWCKKVNKALSQLLEGKDFFCHRWQACQDWIGRPEEVGAPLHGMLNHFWNQGYLRITGEGNTHYKYSYSGRW